MSYGPWTNEPITKDFEFAGLECAMRRRSIEGHWCGYVGVPSDHPWYGKDYNDLGGHPDVHGGLTFSRSGYPKQNDLWWFGFDCAHLGDLVPEYGEAMYDPTATYKTERYVENECKLLARQLSEVSQ